MLRLRGGVRSSFGERIKVNFECVFCTLGWSSTDENNPPQCTLLDYSKVASVLTEFRTEVCWWDFHRNYVLERLVFHGMPRTSSVVVQGKWSRVRVSLKWSWSPMGMSAGVSSGGLFSPSSLVAMRVTVGSRVKSGSLVLLESSRPGLLLMATEYLLFEL